MAGRKGQKKRVSSDDEERLICAQARVYGVSVVQVARRYAMNANLIHKWLRDPRFASADHAADVSVPEGATFPPVEVAGMEPIPAATVLPTTSTGSVTAQHVAITLSDGRKTLKPRCSFPTEEAATKLIFLAIRNFEKGGRKVRGWVAARSQRGILFTGSFDA